MIDTDIIEKKWHIYTCIKTDNLVLYKLIKTDDLKQDLMTAFELKSRKILSYIANTDDNENMDDNENIDDNENMDNSSFENIDDGTMDDYSFE